MTAKELAETEAAVSRILKARKAKAAAWSEECFLVVASIHRRSADRAKAMRSGDPVKIADATSRLELAIFAACDLYERIE